ncbi:hypothetical protein MB02_07640 [Croceicoccus estronivorus]|uniref:DUF3089 domain-containing protein n=1 Tax=Croceicoccus estronivorus TaxID=1172626 RepID=UPI00082B74A7|nr:DUF3089 domain-containing protein [Croceicoccus estronivorus]OCC24440.1 hypothetical protein MB02_07640 [Croceicoccus estronivorus]
MHAAAESLGSPPTIDYALPDNWLCLPGRADACTSDQSTTVVAADGTATMETFSADAAAPIDCFYIYPTVSLEKTANSDMIAGPAEEMSAAQQFARFASVCRLYAPMYRQVTLNAHQTGGSTREALALAYGDVRAAWREYFASRNHGRGVILIAHSQGARHLARLLRDEFAADEARSRLIAAYVIGFTLPVEADGGYAGLPFCHAAGETGCVVNYESFRAESPPGPTAMFGRLHDAEPGVRPACTNPASLAGGEGELHAYLTEKTTVAWPAQPVEWARELAVKTPFVSLPGLLVARCVETADTAYLAITVKADPADPRTDIIRGDALDRSGRVMPDWGLHPIDMHLAMGNLLELARSQRDAWEKTHH